MKKIPTLFVRDMTTRFVTPNVTPGCEWVMRGEGAALRKYDGTAVMKDADGKWWGRRSLKPLAKDYGKVPAEYVEADFDRVTGKSFGWVPIEQTSHYSVFREVIDKDLSPTPHAGTYELCGPTINGNPEGLDWPGLVLHTHAQKLWEFNGDVTYGRMRAALTDPDFTFEGVVWHHRSGDGRMAKLKRMDFPPPRA